MRDVFDPSSEDSASDTSALSDPILPAVRPKRPRKRGPRKEYCAWKCTTRIDCDLFHDKSTDGLTLEEKTNLLKNIYRTACSTINLGLCWRVQSLLIAEFIPALRQGFPSQSHFMFRPKKTPRFLWKRGSATEAFGYLCPADSAGTPSSTPT